MQHNSIKSEFLFFFLTILFFSNCTSQTQNEKSNQQDKTDFSQTPEKDYHKIGSQFLENERIGELFIGLSKQKVLILLGNPSEETELEEWAADGQFHHTLLYEHLGIELEIIGKIEGDQSVSFIKITTPCYLKTKENIGIGSSEETIKNVYGVSINPELCDSSTIVIGSQYGGLIFKMVNGYVTELILGSLSE